MLVESCTTKIIADVLTKSKIYKIGLSKCQGVFQSQASVTVKICLKITCLTSVSKDTAIFKFLTNRDTVW